MPDTPTRWGIIGTGGIARMFAEDLQRLPGHEVLAVGSRSPGTAEAFARRHGIGRAYGSYAELAADADLDVVYIATVHSAHLSAARTCLLAGRPVLVEKPFTVNATEAAELADLAAARGLFAMEAMWTRFNPIIKRLRRLVADKAIGEITALYADFGFAHEFDPDHRLWAPDLAGGALLDLGVYPVSLASMLLGQPDRVHATSSTAPSGVDAQTAMVLRYPAGAVALLHCGLVAGSPQTATVIGTRGRIELAAPFFRPAELRLLREGGQTERFGIEIPGHGYTYQAQEVARCLSEGLLESPLMPLEESVAVLRLLDTVREQLREAHSPVAQTT
ncbi:MAG: Gfo/Idh/MocA family oxidoreductase [Nocardiopsaceae bacterium]|nr:Gfo/Idh/MocA family oxidoreductase [Nocardiopsaceae bacterium]